MNRLCVLALLCMLSLADHALAQSTTELHFTRIQYATVNRCPNIVGAFRQAWTTDRYDAENHFTKIVSRLTVLQTGNTRPEYRSFSLLDDELFDYPWLYAVEVGHWELSQPEADRLREHLLRGGFLMVDDFHGPCEWQVFMESLRRVFPDRPVVDIPQEHEVFQLIYQLDHFTQIWGIILLGSGITYENDGVEPHWRGVFDDDGRLLVAINHNMDLGDAWEHADDPRYPTDLTGLASRFAVNYVIYAMTH